DVVAAAAYPAVLDPVIGSEIAIDQGVVGPALGDQGTPAIGFSGVFGREFLVVWEDPRRQINGTRDIYGAHVSAGGQVVQASGFLISTVDDPFDHGAPSIDFDATRQLYLVPYIQNNAVVARALTPTGTSPLGATIPIAGPVAGTTFSDVDVAWDAVVGEF